MKERAIALWRLAALMRSNQNHELWAIGTAIDKQAIKHAAAAGIEYSDVAKEIENGDCLIGIAAIAD